MWISGGVSLLSVLIVCNIFVGRKSFNELKNEMDELGVAILDLKEQTDKLHAEIEDCLQETNDGLNNIQEQIDYINENFFVSVFGVIVMTITNSEGEQVKYLVKEGDFLSYDIRTLGPEQYDITREYDKYFSDIPGFYANAVNEISYMSLTIPNYEMCKVVRVWGNDKEGNKSVYNLYRTPFGIIEKRFLRKENEGYDENLEGSSYNYINNKDSINIKFESLCQMIGYENIDKEMLSIYEISEIEKDLNKDDSLILKRNEVK